MTIQEIKDKEYLIYEAVISDELFTGKKSFHVDHVIGVYVLPQELILGGHGNNSLDSHGLPVDTTSIYRSVTETIDGIKTTYYELRHFLKLLKNGVPHAIEALFAGDYGIECKESFNILKEARNSFITKKLRYTFGWNSLAKLMKKKEEASSFYNLCSFISSADGKVMNFNDYIHQETRSHINPENLFIVHERGDLYSAFYSYIEASKGVLQIGQQKIGASPTGLWVEASTGMLTCCELREDEKKIRSIYRLGFIYFDSRAHKLWKESIKMPTNLELAIAYRRVKTAISIGEKKTLTFPISDIVVYDNIKEKGNIVSDQSIDTWIQQINISWRNSNLPEYITNETVSKLELQIRQRHHFISTIETVN